MLLEACRHLQPSAKGFRYVLRHTRSGVGLLVACLIRRVKTEQGSRKGEGQGRLEGRKAAHHPAPQPLQELVHHVGRHARSALIQVQQLPRICLPCRQAHLQQMWLSSVR